MRKSLTSFTLASLLFIGASASAVLAQTDAPPPPPPMGGMHGHGMRMDPAKQLAHLTKTLSLTPDQQAQIKPILEDRDQQAMALHSDTSLSQQDKMAKMKGIHESSDAKIQGVLNDQQKQQYAAMKQKQMEMMHEHMKGEAGPEGAGAPPPPPPQ